MDMECSHFNYRYEEYISIKLCPDLLQKTDVTMATLVTLGATLCFSGFIFLMFTLLRSISDDVGGIWKIMPYYFTR